MYSAKTIKSVYEMAEKFNPENYSSYEVAVNEFLSDCIGEYGFPILRIAGLAYDAYHNDGYTPTDFEEKTFYRIGEPQLDQGDEYIPSYNFAADKPENGVSVITNEWLHSLKAVFFNISDEAVQARGIYEMKGIVIALGGDNEPLIYPTTYAKKTNFKSVDELKKVL